MCSAKSQEKIHDECPKKIITGIQHSGSRPHCIAVHEIKRHMVSKLKKILYLAINFFLAASAKVLNNFSGAPPTVFAANVSMAKRQSKRIKKQLAATGVN